MQPAAGAQLTEGDGAKLIRQKSLRVSPGIDVAGKTPKNRATLQGHETALNTTV